MIFPCQFDYQFTTHVDLLGIQIPVVCAFDDPEDVFVWVRDSEYNVTYDIHTKDWEQIKTLAYEHLEQA